MKKQLLATAQVGKAHGVLGYLKLISLSGEYKHFKNITSCILKLKNGSEVAVTIEELKNQASNMLVKFLSYDSPEKAKFLSGSVMYINRDEAPKLEEGEYYVADLIGLDLIVNGKIVSKVEAIADGAQGLYLIIKYNNKELYIPNINPFVGKPSFNTNTIELLMEELLH